MPVEAALPNHCPSCGGPNAGARAGDPCSFCGTPLVPVGTPDPRTAVRCGQCATLVAGGSSFCSSCGSALAQAPQGPSHLSCPACSAPQMRMFGLAPTPANPGGLPVHGCGSCGGVWIDRESLAAILEGAARQAPMAGLGAGEAGVKRREIARGSYTQKIEYRPCPACGQRMMRRNFARVSGIIVDECGPHGSFFDAGELEAVLDFVRSGGLALAQRKDADERARLRKSEIRSAQMQGSGGGMIGPTMMTDYHYGEYDAAAAFVGWAGRWVKNLFR